VQAHWLDILICAGFAVIVLGIIIWREGWPTGSHDLVERAIKERLTLLSLYLVDCRRARFSEKVPATGYEGSKFPHSHLPSSSYRWITVRDPSGREASAWTRVHFPLEITVRIGSTNSAQDDAWPDYMLPADVGWNPPLLTRDKELPR